jgi:septal ring factor EnvC (AmiA/AmiB activator)
VIWNPWRKIRELEARLLKVAAECAALDHALHQSNDRYDKVRDMNAHLREALRLYRGGVIPAPVLLDYIDGKNGAGE